MDIGRAEMSATAGEATSPLKPTATEFLLQQYLLLEERRKYFGSQFIQTLGRVTAIVTVLVGLLGGKSENKVLLRITHFAGGIAFLLLAFLAFRLGQRKDDCEQSVSEIESHLASMGYVVVRLPRTAKFCARKLIVAFLVLLGLCIIGFGAKG